MFENCTTPHLFVNRRPWVVPRFLFKSSRILYILVNFEPKHRERPQSEVSCSNVLITKAFPDARRGPSHTFLSVWAVRRSSGRAENLTEAAGIHRCTSEQGRRWSATTITTTTRSKENRQPRFRSNSPTFFHENLVGTFVFLGSFQSDSIALKRRLLPFSFFILTVQLEKNQKRQIDKTKRRFVVRANMEILDSTEPFLHWDRNLSELSEDGEIESVLYTNVSDHRSGMDVGVTGSGSPCPPISYFNFDVKLDTYEVVSSCVWVCLCGSVCVYSCVLALALYPALHSQAWALGSCKLSKCLNPNLKSS